MNILFFLTPKSEVAYISEEDTLRQALERWSTTNILPSHYQQNRPLYRNSDRRRSALGHQKSVPSGSERCGEDPHYSHQAQTGQPSGKGRRRYGRPDRKSVKPEFCACIR